MALGERNSPRDRDQTSRSIWGPQLHSIDGPGMLRPGLTQSITKNPLVSSNGVYYVQHFSRSTRLKRKEKASNFFWSKFTYIPSWPCYRTKDDFWFEIIFLLPPPECWDYRYVQPSGFIGLLRSEPGSIHNRLAFHQLSISTLNINILFGK